MWPLGRSSGRLPALSRSRRLSPVWCAGAAGWRAPTTGARSCRWGQRGCGGLHTLRRWLLRRCCCTCIALLQEIVWALQVCAGRTPCETHASLVQTTGASGSSPAACRPRVRVGLLPSPRPRPNQRDPSLLTPLPRPNQRDPSLITPLPRPNQRDPSLFTPLPHPQAVPLHVLRSFRERLGRQLQVAEGYRAMLGEQWLPSVGAAICAAHYVEHQLRLDTEGDRERERERECAVCVCVGWWVGVGGGRACVPVCVRARVCVCVGGGPAVPFSTLCLGLGELGCGQAPLLVSPAGFITGRAAVCSCRVLGVCIMPPEWVPLAFV